MITLQPRDECEPGRCLARCQDFLETTGRTTEKKNKLCLPTGAATHRSTISASSWPASAPEMTWQRAPDLQEWVDRSRLNITRGLGENEDRGTVRELQAPRFAALSPALDKLQVFAVQATPQERARMFEVAKSARRLKVQRVGGRTTRNPTRPTSRDKTAS